jgi:hypothetical protein
VLEPVIDHSAYRSLSVILCSTFVDMYGDTHPRTLSQQQRKDKYLGRTLNIISKKKKSNGTKISGRVHNKHYGLRVQEKKSQQSMSKHNMTDIFSIKIIITILPNTHCQQILMILS